MNKLISIRVFLLIVILGWSVPAFTEQPPAPRGELRIVDKRPTNRYSIERHRNERLVDVNPDGTMVPRLASTWRWIDDRTFEMILRQGVRFHNGEVLEAEHVKLSFDLRMEYNAYWGKVALEPFPLGSKLEIRDSHTVRFVFPVPIPEIPSRLGVLRIINRQFVQELDRYAAEKNRPRGELLIRTMRSPGPWGTGPYKDVEGESQTTSHTKQIVLEANLDYWDKARFPRVKRLVFDHTLSTDQAIEAVKTGQGQVDLFVDVLPIETLRVAQSVGAKVVKERSLNTSVIGIFNMLKPDSPWRDIRLRQAANYAVNRAHFLRYAAKGNGVLIPAMLPPGAFGYDDTLSPYAFNPTKARRLLEDAGYAEGLSMTLVAPEHLNIQATVVSKMLEQSGFRVYRQLLGRRAFFKQVNHYRAVLLRKRQKPVPPRTWDMVLVDTTTASNEFAATFPDPWYRRYTLGGALDWIGEPTQLQQLRAQLMATRDREQHQALFQQMERHIHDQAYFLSLYAPIHLYAVNEAVNFVPHRSGLLLMTETSVTDQHWSVRKSKVAGQK